MVDNNSKQTEKSAKSVGHQVRRLAVFQLKLAADALRDILLSPASIFLTLIDIFEGKRDKDSHFNKLLAIGRKTERRINLFNQHDNDVDKVQTVDSLVEQLESIVVKEYKGGELSSKARTTLEKTLKKLRKSRESNEEAKPPH
ncbi:hypothetical protein [Pleionea sediminis]|uniref:hypothetical protein n=1 Tax=Pleionea sediminis TaxID=2569479 RepID=UPI001185BD71|nr:hypothetical protein [Pleionea sediminis]